MSADPNADRMNAAMAPINPPRVATSSNYGDKRTCKDSKGNAIISCEPTDFHPGVDLLGRKPTPVVAPHDGWILFSGAAGKQAPWVGYGPAVVLLANDDVSDSWWRNLGAQLLPSWVPTWLWSHGGDGDVGDTAQSGSYTLLAHLDPTNLTVERPMDSRVAEVWGRHGVKSHNWREVEGHYNDGTNTPRGELAPQHIMTFQPGDGRSPALGDTKNPNARYVRKGEVLGFTGDAGHTHWEVRMSPLGTHASGQTISPWEWLEQYRGPVNMPTVHEGEAPPASSDGMGWLILAGLAAYALSDTK